MIPLITRWNLTYDEIARPLSRAERQLLIIANLEQSAQRMRAKAEALLNDALYLERTAISLESHVTRLRADLAQMSIEDARRIDLEVEQLN